jgi:nitroreductase
MDLSRLIEQRHSVRKYREQEVQAELIEECLESARLAPSACNSQPWYFWVSAGYDKSIPLSETAFSGIYSMNSFARQAPVLILVGRERARYAARMGGLFRGTQFSLIDIGIACEHLSLKATELGLGSCWFGWFNEKAVKHFLGLKKTVKLDLMISLGYPVSEKCPPKNRKTMEEIRKYT